MDTYVVNTNSFAKFLMVQHIGNEFTINLYQIHARIPLSKEELGKYNQGRTQLRAVYAQKIGEHPVEFMAYRILSFIYRESSVLRIQRDLAFLDICAVLDTSASTLR